MRLMNSSVLVVAAAASVCATASGQVWRSTGGPEGGAVDGVLALSGTTVAIAKSGVYRRGAAETTFTLKLALAGARAASSTVGDGILLVGTSDGAILRSTDSGATWTRHAGPRAPSQPGAQNASIIDVAAVGGTWYAAVPNPQSFDATLYRTTNAGASWETVSTPGQFMGSVLADAGELIVFASESGFFRSIHRSTNGGASWTLIGGGQDNLGGLSGFSSDPDSHPRRVGGRLFVGSWAAESGGAWRQLVSPAGETLSVQAAAAGTFFALTPAGEVWKSADLANWASAAPLPGAARQDGLATDGTTLYAAGDFGLRVSADLGRTWTDATRGIIGRTALSLVSTPRGLVGLHADKLRTWTYNGGTWQDAPMVAAEADQPLTLWSPDNGQNLFAGTAESGVLISSNAGASWTATVSGIPMYGGTEDVERREVQAFAKRGANLFAGTGIGGTWAVSDAGGGHAPPASVVATGGGILRSTSGGASWQAVNTGLPVFSSSMWGEPVRDPILCMASPESALPQGVVLAGGLSAGIFRSTNDGASWTISNTGLPNDSGNGREVRAMIATGSVVVAGLRSFGGGGVFVSTNAGASWSPAGPGLPANRGALAFTADGGAIYVAIDSPDPATAGVFRSRDGGASWRPVGTGLEGRQVVSLAVHAGTVYASVEEAGVWALGSACLADVAGLSGTLGGDGVLTPDDVIVYLNAFFAADMTVADVAGLGGAAQADGQITPDDLIAFLAAFFAGC